MCIAAIINKPISRAYLAEMHKDNPHGGGVAWHEGGAIRFERGLDDAAIWALQQNNALTYPYLLHFRWATHGGITPQLTHPFPLGPRALYGELSGRAPAVLMHNGVWNGYAQYLGRVQAPKSVIKAASDTAIAAYMLGVDPDFVDQLDSIPWACAVMTVDDEGAMTLGEFGRTWTSWNDDGNRYSNLSWLPAEEWWRANGYKRSYTQPTHSWSSGWDWETSDASAAADAAATSEIDDAWAANKDVEPFVDDYLTTTNPDRKAGALEVIKCFGDWQEYVRWRYGDEIANEIAKDAESEEAEVAEVDDCDLVSDEAEVVNAYLARLERESCERQKGAA